LPPVAKRVIVNVDGGARGNPGPAAIAAVATDPKGEVLAERAEKIGKATNNVAEYRALLLGIEMAKELGADQVDFIGDSALIAHQVRGQWKVKDAGLKPLHAEVGEALRSLRDWSIRNVPRDQNAEADRLLNEALDA
jgi:ribonuclease HI